MSSLNHCYLLLNVIYSPNFLHFTTTDSCIRTACKMIYPHILCRSYELQSFQHYYFQHYFQKAHFRQSALKEQETSVVFFLNCHTKKDFRVFEMKREDIPSRQKSCLCYKQKVNAAPVLEAV